LHVRPSVCVQHCPAGHGAIRELLQRQLANFPIVLLSEGGPEIPPDTRRVSLSAVLVQSGQAMDIGLRAHRREAAHNTALTAFKSKRPRAARTRSSKVEVSDGWKIKEVTSGPSGHRGQPRAAESIIVEQSKELHLQERISRIKNDLLHDCGDNASMAVNAAATAAASLPQRASRGRGSKMRTNVTTGEQPKPGGLSANRESLELISGQCSPCEVMEHNPSALKAAESSSHSDTASKIWPSASTGPRRLKVFKVD
jgi:hypothetical protein